MNKELHNELRSAIATGDSEAIASLSCTYYLEALTGVQIDEHESGFLCSLILDPALCNMEDSHPLVQVIVHLTVNMGQVDRIKIVNLVKEQFLRFRDYASCMAIIELLVKYGTEKESVDFLINLSGLIDPEKRSLAPYGLRLVAENTRAPSVYGKCVDALRRLSNDPSLEVSRESKSSLEQLGENA